MEAYRRGASGIIAAWAQKRYRGHRSIPEKILEQLDSLGLVELAPTAPPRV
jgi:ribosomal protein S19E (S16A)